MGVKRMGEVQEGRKKEVGVKRVGEVYRKGGRRKHGRELRAKGRQKESGMVEGSNEANGGEAQVWGNTCLGR